MSKHYTDLRSYLDALRQIGEVQPIDVPVDLDLEIGAISRRAGETGQAAPLFQNIRQSHRAACHRNPGSG
jgi:4-hydroxy-3-polyprenylbenzoate decarboxylase